MDHFFIGSDVGGNSAATHEDQEGELERDGNGSAIAVRSPKATPILVMVDESTGERFARAVEQKGVGDSSHMEWIVQDICSELRSWGASRRTGREHHHQV